MPAKVFFSYSHADEDLRNQVDRQLAILRRQGVIESWHDRRIGAGQDFGHEIDRHLEEADIILLLVSADFLASDYCHDIEMGRAMERSDAGGAIVIPVILRDCLWQRAPFGRLQATPTDGRAVTRWPDRDQALTEVARAIEAAADRIANGNQAVRAAATPPSPVQQNSPASPAGPRSSNLRLSRTFSDRDKDNFRNEAFEFIARFFENSLAELETRNTGIQGAYRRVDANRFTAVIYRDGQAVSRCTVFVSTGLGNGIGFTYNETSESNSYNENLTIDADDQMLFLRGMGMSHRGGGRDAKLTEEGGAELLWEMLISRLR